jgi:hypothetical protein
MTLKDDGMISIDILMILTDKLMILIDQLMILSDHIRVCIVLWVTLIE